MRKSRGADLAYLTTLPPDQARARRMIHDAVESEVAIARDVGAQRRDRSIRRTSVLPTSFAKARNSATSQLSNS
jgi:hypothetical protein